MEDRLVQWADQSVLRIELEQMVNLDRGDWLVVLLREEIRTHDPCVGFVMLDKSMVPSSFIIRSSV